MIAEVLATGVEKKVYRTLDARYARYSMLDVRKTVSGYQIIRKSGWRLSGEQGIRQTMEDRWRTRDELRVPSIEY